MYNLFLDDIRFPKDAYLYDERKTLFEMTFELDWVIVRNYDEFVECIKTRGIPEIVSFDHDLHFEHVRHYAECTINSGYIDYGNLKHKTGKQAAEFLVKLAEESNQAMPICLVHSANEVGRKNIKRILSR